MDFDGSRWQVRVRCRKDRPVSIRNFHNLARPDNMDNQAPLRYVGHVGSDRSRDPIRRNEVRSRRDQQAKEAATVSGRLSPSVTET